MCASPLRLRDFDPAGDRRGSKFGHSAMSARCPHCPRKRTLAPRHGMSHECQLRPNAPQQTTSYSITSSARPNARDFAERDLWNIWLWRADHSGLMLAARITLAHLSIWSTMNFPNSADVNDIG